MIGEGKPTCQRTSNRTTQNWQAAIPIRSSPVAPPSILEKHTNENKPMRPTTMTNHNDQPQSDGKRRKTTIASDDALHRQKTPSIGPSSSQRDPSDRHSEATSGPKVHPGIADQQVQIKGLVRKMHQKRARQFSIEHVNASCSPVCHFLLAYRWTETGDYEYNTTRA